MADDSGKKTLPPPGKNIVMAGQFIGAIVGIASIFIFKIGGAIPGMLLAIGGMAIGTLIAKPIAMAANEKQNKK